MKLTASNRTALVKLAGSLPKGSSERKAVLGVLAGGYVPQVRVRIYRRRYGISMGYPLDVLAKDLPMAARELKAAWAAAAIQHGGTGVWTDEGFDGIEVVPTGVEGGDFSVNAALGKATEKVLKKHGFNVALKS